MQKPEQKEETKKCPECEKFIRLPNYIIHEARCKGRGQVSKLSKIFPSRIDNEKQVQCQNCHKILRQKNYALHKQKCSKVKKIEEPMKQQKLASSSLSRIRPPTSHIKKERSRIQQSQELELIPCPNCGYPQTFEQLDTHPQQCLHRQIQCQQCHSFFPLSLIGDHQRVCANRRRPPLEFLHHSDNEEQEEEQERRPMHPFMLPGLLRHRSLGQDRQINFLRHPIYENEGNQIDRPMFAAHRLSNMYEQLNDMIHLLAEMNGGQSEGLSKQEIQKIKIQKYKSKEESQLCTICYCDFEQEEKVMNLPCKHIFHPECVGKWLQTSELCPVCKQSCRKDQ